MRKFSFVGCAYLLLFCMPLQLSASIAPHFRVAESSAIENPPLNENNIAGSLEVVEESAEGLLGTMGPGKKKKKRHKEKKKRMGGHQNLTEKLTQKGIFGKQKKDSGVGRNIMVMVVPAVAVVGLAFLFAAGTRNKNADSSLEPDPNGTN